MDFDPLSDPLSSSNDEHYSPPTKTPAATSSWARHDLTAEPFSQSWSNGLSDPPPELELEHEHASSVAVAAEVTSGWGGAQQEPEPEAAVEEEESFSYSAAAAAAASEPAPPVVVAAEASAAAPHSPTAPITMRTTSSSLSRARSPSTSAIKEGRTTHASGASASSPAFGVSVTPRGDASPFSRFENDNILSLDTDLSKTPSASAPIHRTQLHSPAARSARDVDVDLKKLIFSAAATGDLDRLQALMDGGDDLDDYPSSYQMSNWTNGEGETPLHQAAYRGHLAVAVWLENAGANVEVPDNDGWTALHNAASKGYLDIVKWLIEDAGASVDTRSKHGYSALMNAASRGHLPIVLFLTTKHKADPLLRNAFGETASDLAAAVFEVTICSVLATYEAALWSSSDPDGAPRPAYNPLFLHSTIPVVLHENQRLARPTLKKLSSLGTLAVGQPPRWSSKALSRNDRRTAFTMPTVPGTKVDETSNRPVFRSEVGLPVVGREGELILPPLREVRSAGRPGRGGLSAVAEGKRPSSGSRRSSNATTALTAVLGSSVASSSSSAPAPSNTTFSAPEGEPAWFWLSDWTVDLTDQSSSPADGWSYASSFDAPADEWSSEPPLELRRILEGGGGIGLGGQKWVRRRRWVRVMKRRLDVPAWGYNWPQHEDGSSAAPETNATLSVSPSEAPNPNADYLVRAQFLAANHRFSTSDRGSIRSGKTVEPGDGELDRVELRKVAARLERATDELRAGTLIDENSDRRRKAEDQLEAFLHQLALIRAELGPDEAEEDSDDEFIYTGRDADLDENDDARSTWTTNDRPASVRSVSGGFEQSPPAPPLPASTSPHPSPYQDLTPQLSRAPEFRVPTHETSRIHNEVSKPRMLRTVPVWEADEVAHDCRRCRRKFSFFLRKHHCRRCGQVVCAACSTHSDALDPNDVVQVPGATEDDIWLQRTAFQFRTCDTCHAALTLPQGVGTASILSASAFFPNPPSASGSVSPSDAGQSDASELQDCPVCGEVLSDLGGRTEQEEHVKDCLETGGGTIAANGRYLVFKLPPGPLVSEECKICFVEFEVGDRLARLACLCYFHEGCIRAWLDRGRSCPFHASK
ncbi:hypothetical protein RQP46_004800 [Phenoliferia psychrophenolica]